MSHFSVLVRVPRVVDVADIEEAVAKLMAPYHEFECTGYDDKYAKDIDITEKMREGYERETKAMVRIDGKLVSAYDNRFYRKPTAEEKKADPFNDKVRDLGGQEEIEVKTKDLMAFAQWLEEDGTKMVKYGKCPDLSKTHKYGYALLGRNGDVLKVIDRTNENHKWDWYSIGGRWTGKLTGYDPSRDKANYKQCFICHGTGTRPDANFGPDAEWARKETAAGHPVIGTGCNCCCGTGWEFKFPSDLKDEGNYLRISQLNMADIKAKALAKIDAFWAQWQEFCAGKEFPALEGPRETALDLGLIDCKDMKELNGTEWKVIPWKQRNRCDVLKEVDKQWLIDNCLDSFSPLSSWARLGKAGWEEKGKMGWFGMSNSTADSSIKHSKGLMNWLQSGDQEDWIVIVDCRT